MGGIFLELGPFSPIFKPTKLDVTDSYLQCGMKLTTSADNKV